MKTSLVIKKCKNCGKELLRVDQIFCCRLCNINFNFTGRKVSEAVKLARIQRHFHHTQEVKFRIGEASRNRKRKSCSEEHKQAVRKKLKGRKLPKEHRDNISKATIGISKSPRTEQHTRNNITAVLKSCCARPNKFEVRALAHLNLAYNNKFKYTGDGSFIVNHRSADAYCEELKIVALFNGIYWHLERYGFQTTEQAKGAVELIESIPFLEAGYKVIFIWEDEV
jgi:hypothetical protein